MPSGWTRWLLEQFEFPFQVVHAADIDRDDLRRDFDALILVDGAYAAGGRNAPARRRRWRQRRPTRRPPGRRRRRPSRAIP